jgi:hypothetical protein
LPTTFCDTSGRESCRLSLRRTQPNRGPPYFNLLLIVKNITTKTRNVESTKINYLSSRGVFPVMHVKAGIQENLIKKFWISFRWE